ncbi:MAG: penicillin-binding protein 1B [gamma proteobacterium symbiont of Bathyaustriella thionipta]|nr:penicillin-binding protein 1B [gamma proteobacterium symbiont of Bathyaustriella thionipta]
MPPRKKTSKKKTVRNRSKKKTQKKSAGKKRPTKKAAKKRASTRQKKSAGKPLRKLLAWGFVIGLMLFSGYLFYLNRIVTEKFAGKRWALPARVYGRPLEIFPGADLDIAQLRAELQRLSYVAVKYPAKSGTFSYYKGRFLIHTRRFDFWDGAQEPMNLEVRISSGRVASLKNSRDDSDVSIIRLQAPLIGRIYPSHHEDRLLLQYKDLPELLREGLIKVEDQRFRQHHGVDPKGIARALWSDLRAGQMVQGGSTLTQQLVKNFYLTPERSLKRKINEALMALLLEYHYSKNDILEAYANEIYLGQQGKRAIHGFALGSEYYFGKPLSGLGTHQIALLIGLVKGPSYFNPARHKERALKRRNLVIDEFLEAGLLTQQQAAKAKKRGLDLNMRSHRKQHAVSAFMALLRRQLQRDYSPQDLSSEGLRIFTTLDPWVQEQTEQSVSSKLAQLERQRKLKKNSLQAAAVVLSRDNAEVLAVVGDRNPEVAGFNRALDAVRPVGSLVKPFVYLEALTHSADYTLATLLEDKAVRIKGANGKIWQPRNYGRKAHGWVMLHTALEHSYNLATVHLGMAIGLPAVVQRLRDFGVQRPMSETPALLLGSLDLSPLEVAQMYQALAAEGYRSPLRAITEVMSSDGKPLQRYSLTVQKAAPAGSIYLVNRMLQGVVSQGTGRSLSRLLDTGAYKPAGKTGTTNKLRDSWFAGFTGARVGVVWVGKDDNSPTGLTGSSGAMQVWGDMMQRIKLLPLALTPPEGIHFVWIDRSTGLLSAEHCENAQLMPFIRGSEPKTSASCAEQETTETATKGFMEEVFEW